MNRKEQKINNLQNPHHQLEYGVQKYKSQQGHMSFM